MTTKIKYGVVSDVHLHNWSAFSTTDTDGVNSRLRQILDELESAACEIKNAGGKRMYIAGDLFHVRGAIAPSVMNPAMDAFKRILDEGIEVRMIPGNHDLESKDSRALTNANQALAGIGCIVCNELTYFEDDQVLMVPWFDKQSDMMAAVQSWRNNWMAEEGGEEIVDNVTLICHAPLNGVIKGIPDHGIDPADLAAFGFERVLVGHYHNHKGFSGEVYSVGALTHQTWSDVASRCGYLLIDGDGLVIHMASGAPSFIDYDLGWDKDEASVACDENYVRVSLGDATEEEIKLIREEIMGNCGARGVIVRAIPKSKVVSRGTATVSAGASIGESIKHWVTEAEIDGDLDRDAVMADAMEVMGEIEEISA